MYRHVAAALFLAGLSLSGWVGSGLAGLAAQAPSQEELEARIDSLLPIRDRVRQRARTVDSLIRIKKLRENALETREIEVGPLTVVVPRDQVESARRIMGEAWGWYEPYFGEPRRRLFQDQILTFNVYRGRRPNIYVDAPAERVHRVEINAIYGQARLREKAASQVAEILTLGLDPELRAWARLTAPGHLRRDAGDAWVYRELVTAPSSAGRRCFQGEVELCWEAAGAGGAQEGAWERLYTPMERVNLARRADRPHPYDEKELEAWEECLGGQADEACLTFLRLRYGDHTRALREPVRSNFLMFALKQGGSGAFGRLVDSEGEIKDRLAAAAGMEPDALVTEWLEEIRQARPRRGEDDPMASWSTLLMVLALGYLATRSTRWRLD